MSNMPLTLEQSFDGLEEFLSNDIVADNALSFQYFANRMLDLSKKMSVKLEDKLDKLIKENEND